MLLAVFSDSHGNSKNMITAVEREKPDAVIFLGDGVADAAKLMRAYPALPVRMLRGNCDHDAYDVDESAILEYDGVRIFAAHGHNHGVKYRMDGFATSVLCSGAKLGLYGHTHRPVWNEAEGLQFLNPGSIGNRQFPTYGLIEIKSGEFICKIKDILEENK